MPTACSRQAAAINGNMVHVLERLLNGVSLLSCIAPAGIGAYTGAAIASIACGERAAVVDANVVRVLARLLKISDDPSSKAAVARFAAEAAALLSPERPGDFNQVKT